MEHKYNNFYDHNQLASKDLQGNQTFFWHPTNSIKALKVCFQHKMTILFITLLSYQFSALVRWPVTTHAVYIIQMHSNMSFVSQGSLNTWTSHTYRQWLNVDMLLPGRHRGCRWLKQFSSDSNGWMCTKKLHKCLAILSG